MGMNIEPPLIGGNISEAIDFLRILDPGGWHNLVALDPSSDGAPSGRTFPPGSWDAMGEWIAARDGRLNLYFSLNEPRPDAPHGKLGKHDIAHIRAIPIDVDPIAGEPLEDERARLDQLFGEDLRACSAPPTFAWDTGGGCQAIWALGEKQPADLAREEAEALGRGAAVMVSGDAVQNIDRILRLPGTVNLPTAAKRAKGRVERRGRILFAGRRRYGLDELARHITPVGNGAATDSSAEVSAAIDELTGSGWADVATYGELGEDLRRRFDMARAFDPVLAKLWGGQIDGADQSGSAFRFELAARLGSALRMGLRFDVVDFASLANVWSYAEGANPLEERALARDWARGGKPRADEVEKLIGTYFEPGGGAPMFPEEPAERPASTAPIAWIDPASWADSEPPLRDWVVDGLIPANEVTLLYGEGGVGKTLLAHQLAVAATTGTPWIGQSVKPARVLMFLCEDSADELHRRHRDICRAAGVGSTPGLRITSRRSDDNLMATFDRQGVMQLRPVWEQLRDDAKAFGADLVIIDTLADVFGGDENSRALVTQFAKGCLGRLGREIGGTVIALGHPSIAGIQSGAGYSGNTGWNNAVRSRLYLQYPKGREKAGEATDIRELRGMKTNYAARGATFKLRYVRGALEMFASSLPASARQLTSATACVPSIRDATEAAVLTALASHAGERLSLSPNSRNFAPKRLLMLEPQTLEPWTVGEIEAGLRRLIASGHVVEAEVGRDAHRHPILGYRVCFDKLSVDTVPTEGIFS